MRICVKKLHLWTLYSVMAATVFAGLVFMFLMLFQCKPLSFFWTRLAHHPVVNIEGEGSCINMEIIVIMTYIYSAFAAFCDFTVGIIPIFVVRKLHMKRQTKMAVVGILSMACMYVTVHVHSIEPGNIQLKDFAVHPPPLSYVSLLLKLSMNWTTFYVCSLPTTFNCIHLPRKY